MCVLCVLCVCASVVTEASTSKHFQHSHAVTKALLEDAHNMNAKQATIERSACANAHQGPSDDGQERGKARVTKHMSEGEGRKAKLVKQSTSETNEARE